MRSVSVIVPSYQGETKLPLLLDSFSRQNFSGSWELIVVLDGSSDASREILRKWTDELPLKVIDRGFNVGRAATLNEGFDAAQYEILVRCDDDLIPNHDYVERYACAFDSASIHGVVGLCRNIFPETTYADVFGRAVDIRYTEEAYKAAPSFFWHFWGGNCGVTRDAWERVGPYDEAFRGYGWEDVDWGFRLSQAGFEIALNPYLETAHRVAATTCRVRFERAFLSGQANARFLMKHKISAPEIIPSAWNDLVHLFSWISGASLGRVFDKTIGFLPKKMGFKTVDLGVQAAYSRGLRLGLKRFDISRPVVED